MAELIGDNKKRTINPEAWKEHNRMYGKEEKPTEEPITPIVDQPIVTPENNLEKILTYDLEGKPIIPLTALIETVINTKIQSEYDTLMQIYESGKWNWTGKSSPTTINVWERYKNKTCIGARENPSYGDIPYYIANNVTVISLREFCDIQKINPNIIIELNLWYDNNRADRASKG